MLTRGYTAPGAGGGGGGVPTSRQIIAGAGLTGGGDLSADRTLDVVAGDASIVVNANDIVVGVISDAQHGTRGGGTQHAVVIPAGAAGFMTGADKTKLDGIAPGAVADHGALTGLIPDDDHTQYALLAGRAGGQSLFGGTVAADHLTLQANTAGTGAGRILANSPIEFAAYSGTTALYGFNYTATESFTAPFIGGGLNFSGTITFSTGTFIYESFRGAPTITTAANPGFAAYTVLQALPAFHAGSGAGHNPLAPLIVNCGPSVFHGFTGTRAVGNIAAVNFAPAVRTTSTGTLNVTNTTGMTVAPKWSTTLGSTVNFGTIRGLWVQNPTVVSFGGTSAGSEIGTAVIGLEFDNITSLGSITKAAVRSALTNATNRFMLLNTGGADSDFGNGGAHWNDNTYVEFGNTVAAPDVIHGWFSTQSALIWSTALGVGGNPLFLRPTAADEWTFQQNNSGTQDIGLGFNVNAIVFGTTSPTPDTNNWFVQFSGPNQRRPWVNGEYADVLWTATGSIAVTGHTISNLDAFKINALGYTLGGGSVDDVSTLHVAAMSSDGIATRSHALRVQGRTRVDGHMNHNENTSLAQLTAHVTQLVLSSNNLMRHMYLLDADASGPWIIRGILNVQVGDSFYIINDGANAFVLGHQDGTAAAIDRIISPTGANLTLGPDEMAKLWYDPTVSRWRILETTGA